MNRRGFRNRSFPAAPRRAARVAAVLLAALAIAGCGATVIPTVHTDAERLEVARRLAAHGDRTAAADLLKGYIDRNAGASDVDQAIYLLGEIDLQGKEWTSAQLEFERLLRDYPESDSAGSASFRLGEALYGQARGPDFDQEFTEKALAQWRDFRATYPDHWRAAEGDRRIHDARDKLARKLLSNADLYVRLRMAEPAGVYYQRVLDNFGDLGLAGRADLGLAVCARLEGRKEEAIARLDRILKEFPGTPVAVEARKERARAEKMKSSAPAKPVVPGVPDIGS